MIFKRFWLWFYGLEKAPSWFNELFEKIVLNPAVLNKTVLPKLSEHLELYSDAILKGYDVILVSHSVGGFYANAALRTLPKYISRSLQPSISERAKKNPLYPHAQDLITSVQIGSPVAETVNESAWVNFKDDFVLNTIRKIIPILPGNIDSTGVNSEDQRGHSLIPSYLRVEESLQKIIQSVEAAYEKLKYPIPFFQPAATIQYDFIVNGQHVPNSFFTSFYLDGKDISTVGEKRPRKDTASVFEARCYDLRLGTVQITGETIVEQRSKNQFQVDAYLGKPGKPENQGENTAPPKTLRMTPIREMMKWNLGHIQISNGLKKDAIEAVVEFQKPSPL